MMTIFVKRASALVSWIVISTVLVAQPAGYYDPAVGLQGEALQTALYNIIKAHTEVTYDNLWTAFQTTDDKANGKVWDMYSDIPGGTPSYEFTFVTHQCDAGLNYDSEGDCYNREHSFPKSWFGGEVAPMYTDLFHLCPTDGFVNNKRDNYPYGEVGTASFTSTNGSKLGTCSYPGYTGIVFEPRDDFKGDFARSYFYMAVRYSNLIATWHLKDSCAEVILVANSYPAYEDWFLHLLMAWHYADPASQKEIDRNNTIYTSYQHNRNPFIDHPEYAALIWPGYAPSSPEPTNHAASFSAHCITLNWTDATGIVLPEGYLVRMSNVGFGSIETPTDGTTVTDGFSDKNINYGIGKCTFGGLTPNTTYYFKIFGYTGSDASIDYKTDDGVQQISLMAK